MPAVRAPAWPARSARPTAEVAAEPCRSANLLAALLQQLLHLPARSGVQQLGQSLQIRRAGSPARRPHRAQAAAAGRRPCHAAMPRGLSAIATSGCRSRARLLPLRKGIRWIHPAGPRHVFHSCPIGGLHLSGRGLRNRCAMRVMSGSTRRGEDPRPCSASDADPTASLGQGEWALQPLPPDRGAALLRGQQKKRGREMDRSRGGQGGHIRGTCWACCPGGAKSWAGRDPVPTCTLLHQMSCWGWQPNYTLMRAHGHDWGPALDGWSCSTKLAWKETILQSSGNPGHMVHTQTNTHGGGSNAHRLLSGPTLAAPESHSPIQPSSSSQHLFVEQHGILVV